MIKNYTSTVPAFRSIGYIEQTLIDHGATSIVKVCENQKVKGINFFITVEGKSMPFHLPAKIEEIEKILKKQVKRPRENTLDKISDQAERTAWKLISDWIDIQMSFIDLGQAEVMEVFMPYYVVNLKTSQTLFEKIKSNGFAMLEDKR